MDIVKRIKEKTLFYQISLILNEHLDLNKSLYKVLDTLSNSLGMMRGIITILNPLKNEISIEIAHGISKIAMLKGKYKIGEGVIGRVIQTGKSVSIPQISKEPLFLDKTDIRKTDAKGINGEIPPVQNKFDATPGNCRQCSGMGVKLPSCADEVQGFR